MKLCDRLRWKGFYTRDWTSTDDLARRLAASDVPFTCLMTAEPWGPDDGPCAPERCTDARACFVESPITRRAPTT